jgi:hypothetical protein
MRVEVIDRGEPVGVAPRVVLREALVGGGATLTHSGSNTLWMAIAWLAPQKNLSFVAVSNVDDFRAVDEAFSTMIPSMTAKEAMAGEVAGELVVRRLR